MKPKYSVKFVSKGMTSQDAAVGWLRQIPGAAGIWGDCRFVFDPELREYDWLVVYDDLHTAEGGRFSVQVEKLACPPERTIFMMAEPSTIKTYGYDFLNQFGTVFSCQEPWNSPPAKTIHGVPGLRWFYGIPKKGGEITTYDGLCAAPPPAKTKMLSTVCSIKAMTHTLHSLRVSFTLALSERLPELEIFGHGRRFISDKKDALDPYRYHLAMENTICPGYITEKLTDPFLGLCLPFYVGAPDAAQFFPEGSFIALDPHDPDGAAKIIRDAIENNEWEKRLPAITEARRLVMEEYNTFAIAARIIASKEGQPVSNAPYPVLRSRRAMLKNPVAAVRFGFEKIRGRLRHKMAV